MRVSMSNQIYLLFDRIDLLKQRVFSALGVLLFILHYLLYVYTYYFKLVEAYTSKSEWKKNNTPRAQKKFPLKQRKKIDN